MIFLIKASVYRLVFTGKSVITHHLENFSQSIIINPSCRTLLGSIGYKLHVVVVGWARPVHSNTGLSAVIFRTKPNIFLFIIAESPSSWGRIPHILEGESPWVFGGEERSMKPSFIPDPMLDEPIPGDFRASAYLCRVSFPVSVE